jgi:hypothetical protein
LLHGLDEIGLTLRYEDRILEYEKRLSMNNHEFLIDSCRHDGISEVTAAASRVLMLARSFTGAFISEPVYLEVRQSVKQEHRSQKRCVAAQQRAVLLGRWELGV